VSLKSADDVVIGHRYARAFLSAHVSEQEITEFLEIGKLCVNDVLFSKMLHVTKGNKSLQKNNVEWVHSFAVTLKLSQKTTDFLKLIAFKKRMAYLPSIVKAVEAIINQKAGRDCVTLVLFAPLSDEELAVMTQKIKKMLHIEPIINIVIKPEILGGYIIRTQSVIIDNSLRKNIEKLHTIMMKGVA
jgi:F-type H+-transporting ATPase subunit delta